MGDPILGVANWLQGGTMAAIESKAKRHYSPANWAKGLAIYNKHVVNGTFIKDFNQPFDKSLIGQIIDQYDAVQGTTRDKFGRKVSRSAAKKLFASDTLYFNMAQGEHHIQVSSLLAMLHKKKVKDKDGKEIPLYEAYELDSEGKIKLKEGIDTSTLKLSKNGIVDVTTQNALHSINKSLHGVYNNLIKH
jgi:Ca2+-binding EF-hand superfamily protein